MSQHKSNNVDPSLKRRRVAWWVVSSGIVTMAALLPSLFHCASQPKSAATTPLPASSRGTHTTQAKQAKATSSSAKASPTHAQEAQGSVVQRVMKMRRPEDQALLGQIERETKQSPPDAVYPIIDLANHGATRDMLVARTRSDLKAYPVVSLRMMQWIDKRFGVAASPKPSNDQAPNKPAARPLTQPINRANF